MSILWKNAIRRLFYISLVSWLVLLVSSCDTQGIAEDEKILRGRGVCGALLGDQETISLRFENTMDLPVDSIRVFLRLVEFGFRKSNEHVLWFPGLQPGARSCPEILPLLKGERDGNYRSSWAYRIEIAPYFTGGSSYHGYPDEHGLYTYKINMIPHIYHEYHQWKLLLDDSLSQSVEVRLVNEMSIPVENVTVFLADTTVGYGPVTSGGATDYVDVGRSYRYINKAQIRVDGRDRNFTREDHHGIPTDQLGLVPTGRYRIRFFDEIWWLNYGEMVRDI